MALVSFDRKENKQTIEGLTASEAGKIYFGTDGGVYLGTGAEAEKKADISPTIGTGLTLNNNTVSVTNPASIESVQGGLSVKVGNSYAGDLNNPIAKANSAVTADSLHTSRTISLTGSVTGSGSFNGSSDLSITTTTNHSHGNITADGKIGSSTGKPLITTSGGVITTGSFGTTANTFCEGNDSRLSNARPASGGTAEYAEKLGSSSGSITFGSVDTQFSGINTSLTNLNAALIGKQDAISDLATIRSNASAGAAKISCTDATVGGYGYTKNAGTVTQVNVGSSQHTPTSGVVSLPSYYTTSEMDAALAAKAPSSHEHTKSQITDFAHTHDDRYYTESETDTLLATKQPTLVSGNNIKTVNSQSLLGSTNVKCSYVAEITNPSFPILTPSVTKTDTEMDEMGFTASVLADIINGWVGRCKVVWDYSEGMYSEIYTVDVAYKMKNGDYEFHLYSNNIIDDSATYYKIEYNHVSDNFTISVTEK